MAGIGLGATWERAGDLGIANGDAGGQRASWADNLRWFVCSWGRRKPVYVVLAEEDASARRTIATTLRASGYEVVETRDGADLVDLLRAWYYPGTHAARVDVIVANAGLFPGESPTDRTLRALPREASATPVVWVGRLQGPRDGERCDADDVRDAVARLVGKNRPPR